MLFHYLVVLNFECASIDVIPGSFIFQAFSLLKQEFASQQKSSDQTGCPLLIFTYCYEISLSTKGEIIWCCFDKNSNVRFFGRDNRTSSKSWSWMILRIPNPWKSIGLLRVSAPFYAILYQLWCPNFKRVNGLHSRTATFAIVWAVACVKDTRLEASLNDWLKMIWLMILKGKIPISDKNCDLS